MDASFRSWLKALLSHWFTAMSGPIAVPLGVAAIFVSPPLLKAIFGITALMGLGFAAYWPWREERIARIAATTSYGWDWTLRDLIQHFEPDALKEAENSIEVCAPMMAHLIDLLHSGVVHAWGREISSDGRRRPLTLMPHYYWADAKFTHWFLLLKSNPLEAAVTSRTNKDFADLRFNKAQVLAAWNR